MPNSISQFSISQFFAPASMTPSTLARVITEKDNLSAKDIIKHRPELHGIRAFFYILTSIFTVPIDTIINHFKTKDQLAEFERLLPEVTSPNLQIKRGVFPQRGDAEERNYIEVGHLRVREILKGGYIHLLVEDRQAADDWARGLGSKPEQCVTLDPTTLEEMVNRFKLVSEAMIVDEIFKMPPTREGNKTFDMGRLAPLYEINLAYRKCLIDFCKKNNINHDPSVPDGRAALFREFLKANPKMAKAVCDLFKGKDKLDVDFYTDMLGSAATEYSRRFKEDGTHKAAFLRDLHTGLQGAVGLAHSVSKGWGETGTAPNFGPIFEAMKVTKLEGQLREEQGRTLGRVRFLQDQESLTWRQKIELERLLPIAEKDCLAEFLKKPQPLGPSDGLKRLEVELRVMKRELAQFRQAESELSQEDKEELRKLRETTAGHMAELQQVAKDDLEKLSKTKPQDLCQRCELEAAELRMKYLKYSEGELAPLMKDGVVLTSTDEQAQKELEAEITTQMKELKKSLGERIAELEALQEKEPTRENMNERTKLLALELRLPTLLGQGLF